MPLNSNVIDDETTHPTLLNSTMSLHVITTMKEINQKKRIQMKIGLRYTVKEKVRGIEDNTGEGRGSTRTRKAVLVCVQAVVQNNKSLFQFGYGQNRYMCDSFLSYICQKQEVVQEVDETIYEIPQRGKGLMLTIDGDNFGE